MIHSHFIMYWKCSIATFVMLELHFIPYKCHLWSSVCRSLPGVMPGSGFDFQVMFDVLLHLLFDTTPGGIRRLSLLPFHSLKCLFFVLLEGGGGVLLS